MTARNRSLFVALVAVCLVAPAVAQERSPGGGGREDPPPSCCRRGGFGNVCVEPPPCGSPPPDCPCQDELEACLNSCGESAPCFETCQREYDCDCPAGSSSSSFVRADRRAFEDDDGDGDSTYCCAHDGFSHTCSRYCTGVNPFTHKLLEKCLVRCGEYKAKCGAACDACGHKDDCGSNCATYVEQCVAVCKEQYPNGGNDTVPVVRVPPLSTAPPSSAPLDNTHCCRSDRFGDCTEYCLDAPNQLRCESKCGTARDACNSDCSGSCAIDKSDCFLNCHDTHYGCFENCKNLPASPSRPRGAGLPSN